MYGDEQWLLTARSTDPNIANNVMQNVIRLISERTEMTIMKVIDGENSPRQIVIQATASTVQSLQNLFGENVIIAPDKPLQLF
ncbi:hypothetical protein ACFOQM_21725 [Paenibacillus sp. GCM10012307]|uniref:Uncharacterized protein n=1 Tax=Paenibacillus roseus TaxID=2798579 RepID=A0A934MT35_9BACL|nr:hypothetical protein [Paenibacillus roseus]MBJ6363849.1 hypothetical protein [Paenibacillus roseus]